MRDEFNNRVKELTAKRVGYRCSNPDCSAPTSGPQDGTGHVNLGVAAHITAASEKGPRFDANITPDERSSDNNAIWLCQNCAKLIDNDVNRFTVDLLRDWKSRSELNAAKLVGKPEQVSDDLALFEATVRAYKEKGTPKYFLDSQDLSNDQRADLYDRAILSEKGRLPKNNPYRQSRGLHGVAVDA